MPRAIVLLVVLAISLSVCLSACEWTTPTLPVVTSMPQTSPTPLLQSPTPIPTVTTLTATSDNTTPSPTITSTPPLGEEPTPTSTPTATDPSLPPLNVIILGCDTGLDILHGMGEVTNAYILINNYGFEDLTQVCGTLTASDEAREHPDKSHCIPLLPGRHQVTIKLTVDTDFNATTSITVESTTTEGQSARQSRDTCPDIGLFKPGPSELDTVQPLP